MSPEGSEDDRVERAARSNDVLVGSVINGKFLVEKAIARGGMGRIYFGRQAPLDRPVALKIVKADSVDEQESQFLKRFLLEASILAKLQHPNVVTLFDYGRIEGAPVEMYFIAMEYLAGETLSDRLRSRGVLSTGSVLAVFRQIARGLREAHHRGIVHRDLKPSNIVIVPDADGEIVKLVDFGIGKVELGEDLTRDGVLVGTPKYMAPEQFDGQSSVASDVYALGIIVYQCLTGMLPFAGTRVQELMLSKLQDEAPPLREVNPVTDAPERLETLLRRMLSRRPEDRPELDAIFEELDVCDDELFATSGRRPMSGSRDELAPRPPKERDTSLPETVITPTPSATGASSALARSGLRSTTSTSTTGFTPRPMATSARPPLPRRSSTRVVVAVLLAIGAAGIVAAWVRTRARDEGPPAVEAHAAGSSSTVVTPAPAAFVLHIRSIPSGAVVTENDTVLGVTPLDVQVVPASIANGPRVFLLKKEGFADKPIAQAVASADVEQVVTLAADSPSRRPEPPGPGKPPSSKASPPKTEENDIWRKR